MPNLGWRWPLIDAWFRLRGEPVCRLYAMLERSQWEKPERLAELQAARLRELLAHASADCPAYSGVAARLEAFPVLTKAGLREKFDSLRARSFRGRTHVQHSGGSTGEPSAVLLDEQMHAWRVASGWRGDSFGGLSATSRFLYLWGHNSDLQGLSGFRSRMHAWVFNRYLTDIFTLSEERARQIHATMESLQPEVIAGYSSGLLAFAEAAGRLGLRPSAVRKVMPTAEMCSPSDASRLQAYFGAPVLQRYGAREVGDIAHQCEHGSWHIHSEHVLLEVQKGNGEISQSGEGRLLVTCLSNFAMPIIRYEIGDYADLSPVPCPCGRGLPTFAALHGRIADFVKLPDGSRLSSLLFNHLLRDVPLRQFRIIQDRLDHLTLLIVPLPGYTPESLQNLRDYLEPRVAGQLKLDVETVAALPDLPGGKLRQVVGLPE